MLSWIWDEESEIEKEREHKKQKRGAPPDKQVCHHKKRATRSFLGTYLTIYFMQNHLKKMKLRIHFNDTTEVAVGNIYA
jgi:hypothetical protein